MMRLYDVIYRYHGINNFSGFTGKFLWKTFIALTVIWTLDRSFTVWYATRYNIEAMLALLANAAYKW